MDSDPTSLDTRNDTGTDLDSTAEDCRVGQRHNGSYYGSQFGYSVAVSGDYAIIGCRFESDDTTRSATNKWQGAAYLFQRDESGTWNQVQKIVASDRAPRAYFGYSVAITGTSIFAGAPGKGAVYVFERDNEGVWNEAQRLVGVNDGLPPTRSYDFGYAVCANGNRAIIGAHGEGRWNQYRDSTGAAYIFEKDEGGTWRQMQRIVASDRADGDHFGTAVAIDGDDIMVGVYRSSFDAAGGDSLRNAGAVYVFRRDGDGTWDQTQKIVASSRESSEAFGNAVSIAGRHAIIGSVGKNDDPGADSLIGSGAAHIFERDDAGVWTHVQKIVAPERRAYARFGHSVSLEDNRAIVGAALESEDARFGSPSFEAGAAYIFERNDDGIWNHVQRISAFDREVNAVFGWSVAIDGDNVMVGATGEDGDVQGGSLLSNAGAVYIFEVSSTTSVPGARFADRLSLHPQPVDAQLHIDLGGVHSEVDVTLRNALGQTILDRKFSSTNVVNLNVEAAPGLYFAVIRTTDGETATLKFLKR